MKEFTFEHALNSSIKVIIEARTFSEAHDLLKTAVKYVEDYFYPDDKQKVLS